VILAKGDLSLPFEKSIQAIEEYEQVFTRHFGISQDEMRFSIINMLREYFCQYIDYDCDPQEYFYQRIYLDYDSDPKFIRIRQGFLLSDAMEPLLE